MKKYDFNNISIVSHIRIDCKDRLENFVLRNSFFERYCSNLEFVNVEDDTQRKTPRGNNEIHHLTNNSGKYNKNISYNIGFGLTSRPYILFLDIDCLFDPQLLFRIVNETDKADKSVIYPFDSVFYLKKEIKDSFKKNPNIENLIISSSKIDKNKNNHNKNGTIVLNSCGGAIFTSRAFFTEVNGFNPNFWGWGYEDSEFRDRLGILGKPPSRLINNTLYHLPHGDHYFHRYKQDKESKDNKREYDKVIGMTREQCQEYIKTWKL